MHAERLNNYGYLDRVRISVGIDKCKDVFDSTCKNNRRKAVTFLNDQRMSFPCLFILLPQIKSFHLETHLSRRNGIAVGIVDQILTPEDSNNRTDYLSAHKGTVQSVLKWILITGSIEDSLNDDYKQILDIAISVLINTYQDKSILPIVDDMIFKRSKEGHNVHDLVWSFFRLNNPHALKLVAEHLRSSDKEEVELACKLLNIEASDEMGEAVDHQKQYEEYLAWLEENDPFLYFTGESFQFASKPVICKVDLERKYLHKGIPSYSKLPITPLNRSESYCLKAIEPLNNEDKTVLSEYSHKIRKKNVSQWKEWIGFPIDEQLKAAKAGLEGTK